jgi:MazG family protein
MNIFDDFCETIRRLRDPNGGCPWDLKQTHATLRRYMLEEAYEAVDAMSGDFLSNPHDAHHLAEELGDVLLQVVLNAQVAKDANFFSIEDVIQMVNQKMRRRHPHVFAEKNQTEEPVSEKAIRAKWEQIKELEGKVPKAGSRLSEQLSTISKGFPSTTKAQKIGRIAEKMHFDWDKPVNVLHQLKNEIVEVTEAFEDAKNQLGTDLLQENLSHVPAAIDKIAEEIGDVYFTLAQLCRHLCLDSEIAATTGNRKFTRRFLQMEELALQEGLSINMLSLQDRERLWAQVKINEASFNKLDMGEQE